MNKYIITTDDTTDLPVAYYEKYHIPILHLSYVVNDVIYDGVEKKLTHSEFYNEIRNGAMPYTQQVNPESSRVFFEKLIKEGYDILHIAFSSGLSGTCNSAIMGANEVLEEYPDARITVIDSLCASMGEGLLVHEAVKCRENGMDYDSLVEWVETHKLQVVHEVLADDLFHLHRGGRVSKVAAVVGSSLGVKPIIHVNDEGKLIPFTKQRHKGAALKYLAANLEKKIKITERLNTVAISHSDCPEDAEKLANMLRDKYGIQHIIISDIGPTIGSHTGIGTVAVFYFADSRAV